MGIKRELLRGKKKIRDTVAVTVRDLALRRSIKARDDVPEIIRRYEIDLTRVEILTSHRPS